MRFFPFLLALLLPLTAHAQLQRQAPGNLIITAVGDLMLGTDYPADALPPQEGRGLFQPVKPWFSSSDIRFGNLEGTLFDGPPQADGKATGPNRYLFRTPTRLGKRFSEAGFDVMSLANNHVRDFGAAGLASTKSTLQALGIRFSSKTPGEVTEVSARGKRVAWVACDYYEGGRSMLAPGPVYEEVRELKRQGKLVFVSVHAGGEGSNATRVPNGNEIFLGENRGNSIAFARGAIDAGADGVIMHGPHVPRALELHRNRLIAYSLGNFITGKGIRIEGVPGLAPLLQFEVTPEGAFVQAQIASFVQARDPQRIERDGSEGAYKLMRSLSESQFGSKGLAFGADGKISRR